MPRSNNKPANKPVVNSNIQTRLPFAEQPSLFSSMKQGFGFGIGSSIAHNIFGSNPSKPIIIDRTGEIKQSIEKIDKTDKTDEFKQCMEKTYNNYEECAPILK